MKFLKRLYRKKRSGKPVVVVSGIPRSGTSMMMGMLEAGGVEILTEKDTLSLKPSRSLPRTRISHGLKMRQVRR